MDNLDLFNYSLANLEGSFDENYQQDKIVITADPREKNLLMENNDKLIELLTTYKVMSKKFTGRQEDEILSQVDDLMFTGGEQMNYTALSQFSMACDMSYSVLSHQDLRERKESLRYLIKEYIKRRHSIYLRHGYTSTILQVVADNYSHKRQGSSGSAKIKKILEKFGVDQCTAETNIDKENFYLLTDQDGKRIFQKILSDRHVKLEWSHSKQGKMPDILLQLNGHILIVEHKHKKETGGGQNSQNTEVVDFIKYGENAISYVTFMDGILFNVLAQEVMAAKSKSTKDDIVYYLNKNKENYFVNTRGFEKLLEEALS